MAWSQTQIPPTTSHQASPAPTTPTPPPGGPLGSNGFAVTFNLVPLAVLGLQAARAEMRRNVLRQYAAYTGGVVYTPWKSHSVQSMLQQIAVEINSEYILTYVPSTVNQPGFHGVVLARAGYFYGPDVK